MKLFRLGQRKTIYISKELTFHSSKKGIEVIGDRNFRFHPETTAHDYAWKVPSFPEFLKSYRSSWAIVPLQTIACLACKGVQGMEIVGHPNEAHGKFIPCPFCRGSGAIDEAQAIKSYGEFISELQKQINYKEDKDKRTEALIDKLTPDELDLLTDYFQCEYCS